MQLRSDICHKDVRIYRETDRNVSCNSGAETGAVAEESITAAAAGVTEAAAAAEGAGGATMMAEAEDTAEGRGEQDT